MTKDALIMKFVFDVIIRPPRTRSAAAYSRQTLPRTFCRSVRASLCPVNCEKTADWIRMPFGIIGRTGSGMRQVLGFSSRSTGRGTFGGAFGAHRCNQWGLYGVRVQQRRDAALFPNYFGQTCLILVAQFPDICGYAPPENIAC